MRARILVGILTCGAVMLASHAEATQVNIAGAAFEAENGQYSADLMRLPDLGIGNGGSRAVVGVAASLDHSPSPNGLRIYFDGFMQNESAVMWCGVTSINYNGTVLYSENIEILGYHGPFEQTITLTAAQAPVWAYITVNCQIPINQVAWVYGATAVSL